MIPFVLRFKSKGSKRCRRGNALSQQGGMSQLQGDDQPQEVGAWDRDQRTRRWGRGWRGSQREMVFRTMLVLLFIICIDARNVIFHVSNST